MADICPPGKNVWPALVGVKSTTAENIIKKDNPNVKRVETVLAGSAVTEDIRCDRVRLFVNIDGKLVEIPRIG